MVNVVNRPRIIAAVAFVAAAAGIVIQILAGADYPTVPPGLIILVAGAAVCVWWRRWWALLIPAVLCLFLLFGAVAAPGVRDNIAAGSGRLWGTLLQLAAMLIAAVAVGWGIVRERHVTATSA
jgi:hypothetical protein